MRLTIYKFGILIHQDITTHTKTNDLATASKLKVTDGNSHCPNVILQFSNISTILRSNSCQKFIANNTSNLSKDCLLGIGALPYDPTTSQATGERK